MDTPGPAEPDDIWTTAPSDEDPVERRRGGLVLALVALGSAAAGYGLGALRSGVDSDRGSSATTTSITLPASAVTASTAPAVDAPVTAAPEVPTIRGGIGFDEGLPEAVPGATVTASDGWSADDGELRPPSGAVPADLGAPLLPDEEPSLAVEADEPISVANIRLRTPTGFSGISLTTADGTVWQLVAAPDLDELRLYEVRDGTQQQRAFVTVPIPSDTTIGLYLVEGGIGVVVDGTAVEVETFFGSSFLVDADTTPGRELAVVVGTGQPVFDDIAFG